MALAAKVSSWCFCQLNIVGCLLKKRLTKGGEWSGAPQKPPGQTLFYKPTNALKKAVLLMNFVKWYKHIYDIVTVMAKLKNFVKNIR